MKLNVWTNVKKQHYTHAAHQITTTCFLLCWLLHHLTSSSGPSSPLLMKHFCIIIYSKRKVEYFYSFILWHTHACWKPDKGAPWLLLLVVRILIFIILFWLIKFSSAHTVLWGFFLFFFKKFFSLNFWLHNYYITFLLSFFK